MLNVFKYNFVENEYNSKMFLNSNIKQELMRKDWMFRLVGRENFVIGKKKLPGKKGFSWYNLTLLCSTLKAKLLDFRRFFMHIKSFLISFCLF